MGQEQSGLEQGREAARHAMKHPAGRAANYICRPWLVAIPERGATMSSFGANNDSCVGPKVVEHLNYDLTAAATAAPAIPQTTQLPEGVPRKEPFDPSKGCQPAQARSCLGDIDRWYTVRETRSSPATGA
jgi:hypothetical protein